MGANITQTKSGHAVMPPISSGPESANNSNGWAATSVTSRSITSGEPTNVDTLKTLKVVMIDDFAKKQLRIDMDFQDDISHGRLGEAMIADHQTNLNVSTEHVSGDDLTQLRYYANNLPPNTAAVTLASGIGLPIEELRAMTGIANLDLDNIQQHRREIISAIVAKSGNNDLFGTVIESWKQIDQIVSKGVPVYVAIGNYKQTDDKTIVNLLSLANGASVVTPDSPGATFGTRLIHGRDGMDGGYDLTENGSVDIKFPETSLGTIDDNTGSYLGNHSSSRATFWAAVLKIRELANKG